MLREPQDIPKGGEAAEEGEGEQELGEDGPRAAGLGGEIGAAGGADAAGGSDFVSTVSAGGDGLVFGIDDDGDGDAEQADEPMHEDEAEQADEHECDGGEAAAAGADAVSEAVGVDGIGGVHGNEETRMANEEGLEAASEKEGFDGDADEDEDKDA
jgi:hypothetical protein